MLAEDDHSEVRRLVTLELGAARPPANESGADGGPPPQRLPRPALRELRSLPTLLLVASCLVVGIPLTILLTPSQELTVAGQHLSVGARAPSPSLSGPAQLVQIGNTKLDISRLQVYGPLRPQLTLGPVQRGAAMAAIVDPAKREQVKVEAMNTIGEGFIRWYGWATLGLLAFTVAATAVAGWTRVLITLRRQSRNHHQQLTIADIWHRSAGQLRGMMAITVLVTMLAWASAGALTYQGAVHGLRNVRSLSDLAGTYHLSPSPVGSPVSGYTGAVIGDSRASRVGGPPVAEPTPDDTACARSTDSLAAEVGTMLGSRMLNLACPGASIAQGLRGPQEQGGRVLPAQIGRLKQVQGLEFVVIVIGPNDLYWGDFLAYCYAVDNCTDNLTQGEFEYRLAAFDRDYGDLLQDLNDLPGAPQIIVVISYDVFKPDADCDDARGPTSLNGLNRENIELLINRNSELNEILASGAEKYGFDVVRPRLTTLCEPDHDQLGPDLQGLNDPHPFHPTGIGMIRLASYVTRAVKTER
jgi:GDSL-like Lipase/Acylhydrolase family